MVKAMKIAYFVLVATLLAIPALSFFGAKEGWTKLYGWEKSTKVVPLTYASYTNRTFQTSFTEDFSKNFFMRKTFLRVACPSRCAPCGLHRACRSASRQSRRR